MFTALLSLFSLPADVDLDVVYSRVAGEELRMDIYHPNPRPTDGNLSPAIIVVHGGAWVGGKRQDMASLCQFLSGKGFLAATVQYRLAPKHLWPAMLDDVQTAVRYIRANAARLKVDPERIGAAGASAGGHLSLLMGFRDTRDPAPKEYAGYSSRVSAVLNIFGPTDLSSARDYPASVDLLFQMVLGKPRTEAREEIRAASPLTFVDAKSAPVFTIHGKADLLVPVAQATLLDEKLKAAGVPHVLHLIEGMGHELPISRKEVAEAMEKAAEWLKERLAAKQVLENGVARTRQAVGSGTAGWPSFLRKFLRNNAHEVGADLIPGNQLILRRDRKQALDPDGFQLGLVRVQAAQEPLAHQQATCVLTLRKPRKYELREPRETNHIGQKHLPPVLS